jgi:hypothetical protein
VSDGLRIGPPKSGRRAAPHDAASTERSRSVCRSVKGVEIAGGIAGAFFPVPKIREISGG